jgi:hypothetical protein
MYWYNKNNKCCVVTEEGKEILMTKEELERYQKTVDVCIVQRMTDEEIADWLEGCFLY